MVTWSAFHVGSSERGRRTARKPQAVRTSWLPPCMWQSWQVGAAADGGRMPICFRVAHAVLRARVHLPLRVVEAHVAGLAGLRLLGLLLREGVAGVAGVAGGVAVPPVAFTRSRVSASVLRPSLWQPPQPFSPSMAAMGCWWKVGMAFTAAQAAACLPFLNWSTCVEWHWLQVSGVGSLASVASASVLWALPWQVSQPTATWEWRDSFQSATTPGERFSWQATQASEAVEAGWAGGAARRTAAIRNPIIGGRSFARVIADIYIQNAYCVQRDLSGGMG